MAKIQLLLCFTILFASVTLLDVVSAHLKLIKPTLPQIEPPQTVKDVEPYTVKVVMVFVSNLEKECPKTNKFKAFFERLRGYAKFVCPIQKKGEVDYEKNLKAKAGSLFQAISSFAVGKIRKEIQEEKAEVIRTFKFMRFVATKIMEGRKRDEIDESKKLTAEQQKEIKEGIMRWETIITKITNTMIMSTTNSSSSSTEVSTTGKGSSSENNKSSGSGSSGSGSSGINNGASFDDTTGSSYSMGSPSGSPSSSPSGSSGTSLKDTTGGSPSSSPSGSSGTSLKDTTSGSPSSSPSGTSGTSVKDTTGGSSTQTGSTTSKNVETSQSKTVTVTQVETETSQAVSSFIMNLEKKCPQKEEYKVFFENLKATMIAPAKVASRERKGFFSRIKSAAGKLSDAMAFMKSRIGSKSAEVKKSMETYQAQMMKTMQELETIHSQIVSQNQGKKGGALTCSPAQQAQIKQTITKWEQVTTQFVETAVKSETQTSTTSSFGKQLQAN